MVSGFHMSWGGRHTGNDDYPSNMTQEKESEWTSMHTKYQRIEYLLI